MSMRKLLACDGPGVVASPLLACQSNLCINTLVCLFVVYLYLQDQCCKSDMKSLHV